MRTRVGITASLLLLFVAVVDVAAARAQHGWGGRPQSRNWLGEDGVPLPFHSDADIKEFLATARVIEVQDIPVGVTDPLRVTLEKDGVRAHAVFRYVDRLYDRDRVRNGRMYIDLKDSYRFEPAAYELALPIARYIA